MADDVRARRAIAAARRSGVRAGTASSCSARSGGHLRRPPRCEPSSAGLRTRVPITCPYRDLWRFYRSWEERSSSAATPAVAPYASELYEPVRLELDKLEWARLVEPVAGRPTNWAGIDARVRELREAYSLAQSSNDCKAIGLQVGALLQALGRHVFDPERHLPEGESVPSRDDAKRRIGFYVDTVTRRGDMYAEVRKLANATMRLAEAVKHAPEPTRTGSHRSTGVRRDPRAFAPEIRDAIFGKSP